MAYVNRKLGAFIVPTGIGASIGGYAGDAAPFAREFAKHTHLIVNPNVVNAGGFSGISDNMFYMEGYIIDLFFKGEISIIPSTNNKIGIIYDKSIPKDVLNVHINTHNAVSAVYGIQIHSYTVTEEEVGVEFYITEDGISTGNIKNIKTLDKACNKLLADGCNAIAVVCFFEEPEEDNPEYSAGLGVDPVGGVEAVISHYISKHYLLPCAHSPAFADYTIYPELVNPKAASEYITPTFLPCILLGLANAPHISQDLTIGLNVNDLDFLVMPYDSLGSIPVFEAIKRNIPVYAVKENTTALNITKDKLFPASDIIEPATYKDCLELILKN